MVFVFISSYFGEIAGKFPDKDLASFPKSFEKLNNLDSLTYFSDNIYPECSSPTKAFLYFICDNQY